MFKEYRIYIYASYFVTYELWGKLYFRENSCKLISNSKQWDQITTVKIESVNYHLINEIGDDERFKSL